jgi:hypothetical protein
VASPLPVPSPPEILSVPSVPSESADVPASAPALATPWARLGTAEEADWTAVEDDGLAEDCLTEEDEGFADDEAFLEEDAFAEEELWWVVVGVTASTWVVVVWWVEVEVVV